MRGPAGERDTGPRSPPAGPVRIAGASGGRDQGRVQTEEVGMGPATWGACVRQLPRWRRLLWAIGLGLAGVALFPLLLVAQVTATSAATTSWNVGSAPTPAALADIPPDYLALYQAAARTCEGLGWGILAGIGKVESDHGRSPLAGVRSGANAAGAAGPMQLGIGGAAGNTWGGAPVRAVPPDVPYGTDGGGDGVADVYDPADAIFAAARLLCANGAGDPRTLEDAVWAYNHSPAYYRQVIAWAARYVEAAGACGEAAAGAPSPAAAGAVCFALAQLGKPYLWGGTGPDRFDCSGLTMMAYRSVGVAIPRTSAAQFRGLPAKVPVAALLPGDLVFYATDLTDPATIHHVGMVITGGRMIEAPYTGASIRIRPWDRPDLIGAVRPAG